jgi:hypothetical protein
MSSDARLAANLRRWKESGQPLLWIDWHRGQWDHDDWLALLDSLHESEFWPLDPGAVGLVLEGLKVRWHNLRRWLASGEPRRWVEERQGQWNHDAWLALLEGLRQSEFWPLDPDAVGLALDRLRRQWHNLRRWLASGEPRRWVEAHGGRWDHDDWVCLLADLEKSEFWPLDPDAVGMALEAAKAQEDNLQRWRESGEPLAWVEAHRGEWGPSEWLFLLDTLRESGFWPLDPASVGRVLEEVRDQWRLLRLSQQGGQDRLWTGPLFGEWQGDWLPPPEAPWEAGSWPPPEETPREAPRVLPLPDLAAA